MDLTQQTCVPCRGGIPPLEPSAAGELLANTPGWELLDEATKIRRDFKLANFAAALDLVNKVGELAESEGHHPDITFGWGHCSVLFYTHKIKGLHQNDFIMAAKVNALAGDTSD
ncbi:MAG: 4a-hydroxytetrahydrobiopterin dehydratase [Alphaproteobacteria bacterium]